MKPSFSDTVYYYWQIAKLGSWHLGVVIYNQIYSDLDSIRNSCDVFKPNFNEISILKITPAGFLMHLENYISGSLICCKKFNCVKFKPPKGAGGWKGLIKETSGSVWMAPIASKVIKPLNCSSTWTKLIFWLAPIPIKAPPTVSSRPGSQIKL